MKIIKLTAENVKKLIAVEITPNGNLVEITGKNAQGKTSVLDSIWWALAGATHIQAVPIRKGANKARIRLDFGEIVVTRTFTKTKGGGATTSIVVQNAEGQKQTSPQTILNGLIGELSFDPLAFSRMDSKDQFQALRRFVPGVDFDAIAKENEEEYQKRTEINRQAKSARAQADAIHAPIDVHQSAPIDEAGLVDELQKAGEHNALTEQKKANRERLSLEAEGHREAAVEFHERAQEMKHKAERLDAERMERTQQADAIEIKLQDAGPLPVLIDPSDLRNKIAAARETNEAIKLAKSRTEFIKRATDLEEQAKILTRSMENRDLKKREAIENAKMPVEEIGFGDGEVLVRGLPFDQASDAEKLRVSVSIAMAANPKLRVIRVRDGSLLDEDAMKMMAEMADNEDYQVWIERVEANSKTAVVLEDGMVKEAVHE